mmetsp:Transcript_11985/g.21774  ORF Transcript_11985/g.21774 Transcript_11985/m.21774 type:complete len:309 (-) Transcript_11985:261-1187(-)
MTASSSCGRPLPPAIMAAIIPFCSLTEKPKYLKKKSLSETEILSQFFLVRISTSAPVSCVALTMMCPRGASLFRHSMRKFSSTKQRTQCHRSFKIPNPRLDCLTTICSIVGPMDGSKDPSVYERWHRAISSDPSNSWKRVESAMLSVTLSPSFLSGPVPVMTMSLYPRDTGNMPIECSITVVRFGLETAWICFIRASPSTDVDTNSAYFPTLGSILSAEPLILPVSSGGASRPHPRRTTLNRSSSSSSSSSSELAIEYSLTRNCLEHDVKNSLTSSKAESLLLATIHMVPYPSRGVGLGVPHSAYSQL